MCPARYSVYFNCIKRSDIKSVSKRVRSVEKMEKHTTKFIHGSGVTPTVNKVLN